MNNLAIIPHMPTTESIGDALAYGSLLPAHLGELARTRANSTAGAVDFTDLISSEQPRFKTHAIAQADNPPPGVTKAPTKAPPADPKAPNKRDRHPKKQYLAQLAAEKEAAGAVASASSDSSSAARTPSPARSRRRSLPRPPPHIASRTLVVLPRESRRSPPSVLNAVANRLIRPLLAVSEATAPR